MSLRRRNRKRREGAKAAIDMNSLIDLTFLLLVVFIVTLPTLEQSVHIVLPVGKTESQNDEKKKNWTRPGGWRTLPSFSRRSRPSRPGCGGSLRRSPS